MSEFSSDWLELREPIDFAARSDEVLSAVSHYFMNDENLTIADIGCGTGATIRALKPVLIKDLTWALLDNDDALLAQAKSNIDEGSATCINTDLALSLDAVFKSQPDLITTSAFLDLVSREWLEDFVSEVTSRNIPFYAALSYNGCAECIPMHPSDTRILKAFNEHQKTDKGFGPALGPNAATTAVELFKDAGYIVCEEPSDWKANSNHREFQKQLLEGWYSAVLEISPEHKSTFQDWLDDKHREIAEGNITITVGHNDFFTIPA